MNKKSVLVISLILVCAAFSANVKAQAKTDKKESARIFVQEFYDWYATMFPRFRPGEPTPFYVAITKRGKYFDTTLHKAIMDDIHTQSIPPAIEGLDIDPISNFNALIGEQAVRWRCYQTGNVDTIGNRFWIDIYGAKKGQSRKSVLAAQRFLLAVEVMREDGRWVISNFYYPGPDGYTNYLFGLNSLKELTKKNQ